MSSTLRERIVAAAARRTARDGWAEVTMARLAEDVGVSRQTVYNEVGSKTALADELVAHEVHVFLEAVDAGFAAEPENLPAAVERAVLAVLQQARRAPLLRAVVGSAHGASSELLPYLTTRPETLMGLVLPFVADRVARYPLDLPPERVERTVDVVVRAALSQVISPSAAPDAVAEHLGWLVRQAVRA